MESQTGHFSIWIFGAKNKLFDVKNETILELLAMFVYFNAQKKSIFFAHLFEISRINHLCNIGCKRVKKATVSCAALESKVGQNNEPK